MVLIKIFLSFINFFTLSEPIIHKLNALMLCDYYRALFSLIFL
jgi:hypothetical protein